MVKPLVFHSQSQKSPNQLGVTRVSEPSDVLFVKLAKVKPHLDTSMFIGSRAISKPHNKEIFALKAVRLFIFFLDPTTLQPSKCNVLGFMSHVLSSPERG